MTIGGLPERKNLSCWPSMIVTYNSDKCKKTVVYTRVNGALHIENCKNYKKVLTHQHIA